MWKGEAEYKRKSLRRQIKKETRKQREGEGSQRTYPQDARPPSLELSYPWALFSLQEKGNGNIKTELFFNYTIGVESHLGIPPERNQICTQKKIFGEKKNLSHHHRLGSTCPQAVWFGSRSVQDRWPGHKSQFVSTEKENVICHTVFKQFSFPASLHMLYFTFQYQNIPPCWRNHQRVYSGYKYI